MPEIYGFTHHNEPFADNLEFNRSLLDSSIRSSIAPQFSIKDVRDKIHTSEFSRKKCTDGRLERDRKVAQVVTLLHYSNPRETKGGYSFDGPPARGPSFDLHELVKAECVKRLEEIGQVLEKDVTIDLGDGTSITGTRTRQAGRADRSITLPSLQIVFRSNMIFQLFQILETLPTLFY